MNLKVILPFAFRNCLRHSMRSFLILFTLAAGVGGLFAFQGFNDGMMGEYRDKVIHQQVGNGKIFSKGYYESVQEKSFEGWIGDWQNIVSDMEKNPIVAGIYPRVSFTALLSKGSASSSNFSGRGEGIDGGKEAPFFDSLKIHYGKNLTDEPDGIILAIGVAESLNAKVGDTITVLSQTVRGNLNGIECKVAGIVSTGNADLDHSFFRVQLKQAFQLLETEKVEFFSVGLKDPDKWSLFHSEVLPRFPELEAFSFEEMDKVMYQTSKVWLDSQFLLILVIFTSVIFLGVFNTSSLGVLDRSKEIGVLRSNGETSINVKKIFLLEAFILGCAGAALGLIIVISALAVFFPKGVWMAPPPGFEGFYYAQIRLSSLSAVKWSALGIACSLLATLYALRQVEKKTLVELLSHV